MTRTSCPPPREGAEEIRSAYEQKLAAYRRFLSITETLGQKVSARDMADAGKLIAWRQDCIGWIESLDGRIRVLEQSAPQTRTALGALQAEIGEIVKAILKLDESMIGTLAGFRGEMQNRLSELTARKHSFGGYRPGGGRNTGMLSVQT